MQPQLDKGATHAEYARTCRKKVPSVVKIDAGELKKHLAEIVRSSVEDTLNSLSDAEVTNFARQGVMSAIRNGLVHELDIINASC